MKKSSKECKLFKSEKCTTSNCLNFSSHQKYSMSGDKCLSSYLEGKCTNTDGKEGLWCKSEVSSDTWNYCKPIGLKERPYTPYAVQNIELSSYNYTEREKTYMKARANFYCPSRYVTFNSQVNTAESFCGCCETSVFVDKAKAQYTGLLTGNIYASSSSVSQNEFSIYELP